MDLLQYKNTTLANISPTFCGAKWYNATIWLDSAKTSSCHHPPAHDIDVDELIDNPAKMHNTRQKKDARRDMLAGIQTPECEYCWKVENLDKNLISDRVYKSKIYSDEDLLLATKFGADADVIPKDLEIAFDSLCNFACSYCNSSFSSTWATELKKNGIYHNLLSDGAGPFRVIDSAPATAISHKGEIVLDAFMKWWESDLKHNLKQIRITGGEALMSPSFWRFSEVIKSSPNVMFAINSNLGVPPKIVDKLCDLTNNATIDVYTSNESIGIQAEYIRDGLIWDDWVNNVRKVLASNVAQFHFMLTVNALCLSSLVGFCKFVLDLRQEFKHKKCWMSFNILRFPSFQAIPVLPIDIRKQFAQEIDEFITDDRLYSDEIAQLERLSAYLCEVDSPHSNASSRDIIESDFKSFFSQYDKRRGKDFCKSFPRLSEWYTGIQIKKIIPISLDIKN